jgi:Zinc knuckle
LGLDTCHKCDKPDHFRRDCPERQLDRTPTPRAGRKTIAIGDYSDIIVCMSVEDVYKTVGEEICNDWGGAATN